MRLGFILLVACVTVTAAGCGSSTVAPTSTATVVSLSIDGNASLSTRGETSQLTARATLSDGHVEDRTSTVQWSSSDATIAVVSRTGLLTAMGDGKTVVTAKLETVAATKPVLVDLPTH
ncbi:MAG: hypothetical protein DMF91_20755 [Acidobacteria bacterium]|nr:MAG: hypothetical protein DMF91_20755 [Acidobacteriota bacterium]